MTIKKWPVPVMAFGFWLVSWGASPAFGQVVADLAISGGQRFDTDSGTFVANSLILIRDGRLAAVGETGEIPDGCPKLQLADGQYILPGLIDCHAHYNVRLLDKRREEFFVMPIQYLANGSTVTFSCGEYDPEGMMQLRKDIERGVKIGPHLINSGPYFGIVRRPWHADPARIRDEVDFWAEQGVGGFKAKLIDAGCLMALVEQAHKHGLTVTGHLDSGFRNSVNPSAAIDMGIDRIEHFLGGDAMTADKPAYSSLAAITPEMPEFQAIVRKFVETGTTFDATITAYGYGSDDDVFEHWFDESSLCTPFVLQKIAEKNQRRPPAAVDQFIRIYMTKKSTIDDFFCAGGTITTGTDHVCDGRYLPGFSIHREMQAMSEAGIPQADVLRIATINGARALGIDKDFGSLEVGKWGDAVILSGNPLADIRNTRNPDFVIRAGHAYRPAELLKSIAGKLGPANDQETADW
jgi:imidazolonepropionase-like amidohydrolase